MLIHKQTLSLPSETRFLDKFFAAIEEDIKLRDAYFARFDPYFLPFEPEKSRESLLLSLKFYGGYRTRRRLLEAVPVVRDDIVLDIGPEMGAECFMLAEVYDRVLVAEPDTKTADVLRKVSRHYVTEDGRRASNVIEVKQAGIIPTGSTRFTNCEGDPHGAVFFNVKGAKDISDVFGTHFAKRVYLNHLAIMMPQEPKLKVLLDSLASYCSDGGWITWCDSISELGAISEADATFSGGKPRNSKPFSLPEIKKYITALLPGFEIKFHVSHHPHQIVTIASRL